MRTSSYTIYVDLPETRDEQLLIHGYSGAYDLVARPIAEYLRAHEDTRHTPLHGAWRDPPAGDAAPATLPAETLEMLRARGFLTEMSADEERAAVRKLATRRHRVELAMRPTYIVMPSYQCNLRCGYCFQNHMRTQPELAHLLQTMSPDMARRIVRAMAVIDGMHPRTGDEPRNVTLFGGEPLLAEHRPFIAWLIRELQAASPCELSAVSNATQLDAYLDLLGPDCIRLVQVTIDGPPAVHDRRRIHADGSGSFALIAANVTRALERGAQIALRVNVDRSNLDGLPELAREIVARGWHEQSNFRAYAAAVNASNDQTAKKDTYNGYALSVHMRELGERYPELRAIARPSDELRGTVARILRGELPPWAVYKASYCAAHSGMYVFDSFGDIYACWERTGDPSIRVGSIDEDGVPHFTGARAAPAATPAVRRMLPLAGKPVAGDLAAWRERTITTNDTCASCRYAFYCGGGCAAEALDHRGGFHMNNCDGFQQRFRVAAADAYDDVRHGRAGGRTLTVGCDA